jgi:hypothetical protein
MIFLKNVVFGAKVFFSKWLIFLYSICSSHYIRNLTLYHNSQERANVFAGNSITDGKGGDAMFYNFGKRSTEGNLFILGKEFCMDAGRFSDEASGMLRNIVPMKELFVTYVDLYRKEFSFHHGPEVTHETVRFYNQYPTRIHSTDYMARAASDGLPGKVVIDREAIDPNSESDLTLESCAVRDTHNGTMALSILMAPCDFNRHVQRVNPFLRYGTIALTIYGDEYDDSYTEKEKKLIQKYIHCLRMGALNNEAITRGTAVCPCIEDEPIFPSRVPLKRAPSRRI